MQQHKMAGAWRGGAGEGERVRLVGVGGSWWESVGVGGSWWELVRVGGNNTPPSHPDPSLVPKPVPYTLVQ